MDVMGETLKSQLAFMEGYGKFLHGFTMRTEEHLKGNSQIVLQSILFFDWGWSLQLF